MTPLALSRMDGIASPVTLDWSTVRTLHSQTHTNTATAIFTWLQQSPSLRGVHVVLDTLDRCERRKVRNQLLAMGCTVTAKVKFA